MLPPLSFSLLFCCILLLLSQCAIPAVGFVLSPVTVEGSGRNTRVTRFATEDSKKETASSSKKKKTQQIVVNDEFNPNELFPAAKFKDFSLLPHRPLGMRVEESLADGNYVFVSRVDDGGFAQKAGIQVGDVLVGVTGLFGDMTCVIGLGVEKIKGMVASRPVEEPLEIQVARGTSVFEEHEEAVIEICSNESSDKEIEQCVVDYLTLDEISIEPVAPPDDTNSNNNNKSLEEEDDASSSNQDGSDTLDNLFNMWAEDLPPTPPPQPVAEAETEKPAVKPWSSRSSGSGTWVRDPATGEMKNID